MFIAVDGIDGAGKTTLAFLLKDYLEDLAPVVTKEPTIDSPYAPQIEKLVSERRLTCQEEIALFHNDRLWHLEHRIYPALQKGHLVICDRYVDSTLAFQCDSPKDADELYTVFEPDILVPDVTFILQCPVDIGLSRLRQREGSNLSQFETVETLEHAKTIYDSRRGPNYHFIDASHSVQSTFDWAVAELRARSLLATRSC